MIHLNTIKTIASLLVLIEIISLSTPSQSFAQTRGCTNTKSQSCKNSCSNMDSEKAYCSTPPSTCKGCDKNGKYIAGLGTAADDWQNVCLTSNFAACWGQVEPHCMSMNANKEGAEGELITAVLYTALAATCLGLCATFIGGFTAGAYCAIGAIGIAGVDLGISMTMSGNTTQALAGAGSAVVSAGVGAGIMAAGGAMGGGFFIGTTSFETSCVVGGFSTVIAGVKWMMYSQTAGNAEEECNAISSLGSSGGGAGNPGGSGFLATAKGTGTGANTNSASPIQGSIADDAASAMDKWVNGQISPAVAGTLKDLDRKAFAENMKSMGLPLPELARKMATQTPSQILNGMGFANDALKDALKTMDSDIASGKMFENGKGPSGGYAGSGSGGGMAKKSTATSEPLDLASMFGKKKEEPKLTDGLSLKKPAATLGDADDIWHAQSTLSIFEIVSTRIDKSSPKIETRDWASPLNKSLSKSAVAAPSTNAPATTSSPVNKGAPVNNNTPKPLITIPTNSKR